MPIRGTRVFYHLTTHPMQRMQSTTEAIPTKRSAIHFHRLMIFLFYLRPGDRKTDETEIVKKVKEVWPVDIAFGVAAEQQSNECICLPASFF